MQDGKFSDTVYSIDKIRPTQDARLPLLLFGCVIIGVAWCTDSIACLVHKMDDNVETDVEMVAWIGCISLFVAGILAIILKIHDWRKETKDGKKHTRGDKIHATGQIMDWCGAIAFCIVEGVVTVGTLWKWDALDKQVKIPSLGIDCKLHQLLDLAILAPLFFGGTILQIVGLCMRYREAKKSGEPHDEVALKREIILTGMILVGAFGIVGGKIGLIYSHTDNQVGWSLMVRLVGMIFATIPVICFMMGSYNKSVKEYGDHACVKQESPRNTHCITGALSDKVHIHIDSNIADKVRIIPRDEKKLVVVKFNDRQPDLEKESCSSVHGVMYDPAVIKAVFNSKDNEVKISSAT